MQITRLPENMRGRFTRVQNGKWTCYEWQGARTKDGYGHTSRGYVHRMVYALYVGPIPDGAAIDHKCRNRACANYRHLEAVSQGTNVRRGNAPAAINARKTHCTKAGHPLPPFAPGQRRRCGSCRPKARVA